MKKVIPIFLCLALLSSCSRGAKSSVENTNPTKVSKESSSSKQGSSSSKTKSSDVTDQEITGFLKAHSEAVTKSMNEKKNEIASYYITSSSIYQKMSQELASSEIIRRTEKSYEVISIKRQADGTILADTKSVSDYDYGNGRSDADIVSEFSYSLKVIDGSIKIVDRVSKEEGSGSTSETNSVSTGVDVQRIANGDFTSLEGRWVLQKDLIREEALEKIGSRLPVVETFNLSLLATLLTSPGPKGAANVEVKDGYLLLNGGVALLEQAIVIAPKGVVYPSNPTGDPASDINQDRIFVFDYNGGVGVKLTYYRQ